MSELEFWVDGMTCGHCERAVTIELTSLATVSEAQVDALSGHVVIIPNGPVDHADLEGAVEDAGYTVRSWSPLPDA